MASWEEYIVRNVLIAINQLVIALEEDPESGGVIEWMIDRTAKFDVTIIPTIEYF